MRIFKHSNPLYKAKILDFTYTSQPSINTALPLKINTIKMVLFILGSLISSGFLWLIAKWSPKKKAIFLYDVCQIIEATSFLIEEEDIVGGSLIVEKSTVKDYKRKTLSISFTYHQRTYLYHEEKQVFLPIRYEQLGQQLDKLQKGKYQPYSHRMRKRLIEYYGENIINLPVQSKLEIFIEEMLTPYQVFQLYAIILWIYEQYYIFAFLLLGYSLYCYLSYSRQAVRNQQQLRDQSYFNIACKIAIKGHQLQNEELNDSQQLSMIDEPINLNEDDEKSPNSQKKMKKEEKPLCMSEEIEMKTNNQNNNTFPIKHNLNELQFQDVNSADILPGDIIILQQGDTIPCDCLLIHGEALVYEQYISGEDYVIRKRELENYNYQKEKQKSFLLYLGTKIVKVRGKAGQWEVNSSDIDSARHSQFQFHHHTSRQKTSRMSESTKYQAFNFSQVLHPKQIACLVTDTNYNTQRGKYLRAVRYQKKPVLNFTRETILFLYIIILITLIGFLIILPRISENQTSWNLFIIFLDLAGDSIPMTLPAILSMGISFAQHRLSKHQILSVLPSNILAGGLADTLVLDSERIFGKKYLASSITIGRRANGQIGKTYSSLQQFQQFSSLSALSESFHNDPVQKQIQISQQEEKGKMILKSFALCHMLEHYDGKLSGSEEQKSLFSFCEGKFIRDDCYEVLDEVCRVIDRIYFKERDNKFAVIAEVLDSTEQILMRKKCSKSYQQIDKSILEEENKEEDSKKNSLLELDDSKEQISHKKRMILIKGPPEKIIRICVPDTCPESIYDYTVDMAQKGFSLVCFAYKWIDSDFSPQKDLEILKKNFVFSGFASVQKQVYDQNLEAIKNLKSANLKMLLISSQRELEATSQAIRNCLCTKNQLLLCSLHQDKIFCKGHTEWQSSQEPNMVIEEFLEESQSLIRRSKVSLTSKLYESLYMKFEETSQSQKLFDRILICNQMSNKHSRNLYFQLEKKGFVSFAVGNGSSVSQCAHLSLELERGQCSMVSSFHTKHKALSSITDCLIICRAALATNFHAFGMMIHFSLIQFTTVAILEYHYQAITDSQMLYEDLFVTFPIFITINMTKPAQKLSKELPPKSFFSLKPLVSTIGQLLIQFVVQLAFVEYLLTMQNFVKELESAKQYYLENHDFMDTEVSLSMFIITNYLYLGIVLSTSVSEPFRRPFYTNIYYTATLIILWAYNTIIVMVPSLAPGSIRKQALNQQTQQMLVIAMLLGNLVMVCMYMYQKLLQWIWQCWWGQRIKKSNKRNMMIEEH